MICSQGVHSDEDKSIESFPYIGDDGSEFLDEDDCSALFGSEEVEDVNERRRKKQLVRVLESNGIIAVIHHSKKWTKTTHGRCEGLDLESIEKDDIGEYHAFFDVSDEVAELYGCEAGVYQVSQDASIFSEASVLLINQDFVLLGYEGELAYLTPDPDTRYVFRLIWQSPWMIARPKEPTKSSYKKKRRRHKKNNRRRGRRR